MKKNYKFPTQLFVVFESFNPILWTSNSNKNLDYFLLIPQVWFKDVSLFLKKSLITNNSYILDSSAIDLANYNFSFLKKNFQKDFLMYYIFSINLIRAKLFIFYKFSGKSPASVDSVYVNCNWLERESSEMYGYSFINKVDSRKLLLNYFDSIAPLQKTSNSKGHYEVYYSFEENQVQFVNCTNIEL